MIAFVVVVHHPEEDTLDLNLNWTEIGAKLKKKRNEMISKISLTLPTYIMYLYDYENEYYVFYKYFRKNIIKLISQIK